MIPDGDAVLVAEGIGHVYYSDRGAVEALRDVTCRVRRGEFVCLVGPSGCGKSTLLRILAGLMPPTSGHAYLDGEPITGPQRRIGVVFQNANLMPWRTVYDNLALPLELAGVPCRERERRVSDAIRLVGLAGFEDSYPAELSGGMAQRVAIGRALIYEPEVLLLDEPFGALDALTREEMAQELLRIWAAQRTTVLMVTHSIQEAIFLGDRVLVMSPRPGTISREFVVPFPRPRSLDMVHSAEFGMLAADVRSVIGRV